MSLKVAIIGRANVGKSTLFNRLAGRKVALVHDEPGVTRDRRYLKAKLFDLPLEMIDTAGFEYTTNANVMEKRMWEQTQKAIMEADVILFLIDARAGLQAFDEHLAKAVRQLDKPVILLANKCEGFVQENNIYDAYKLGFGEPIVFSAEHGIGLSNLYEALKNVVGEAGESLNTEEQDKDKPLYMAIVGRPNVGKSTLVNALLNDERMLTGPEAGVTRDAISIDWNYGGRKIQIVDTAGLRKQAKTKDDLEKLATDSTKKAVALAQVVVLVLDAEGVLEKQDLTIARQVLEEGRALIIAINKWDIANRADALQRLNDKLQSSLTQASGIPTVTISALKKENLDKLMRAVFKIYDIWNKRIPTAPLNQWFADVMSENPPPLGKNKRRIKLRYITQAKSRPPSFVIFSSNPEGLPDAYLRYLTNSLRETFNLNGVPIRINVRKTGNPYADK